MQVFTFVQGILSLLQAFISPLYSSTYPFCQSIQINEEKNKTTTTNKKSATNNENYLLLWGMPQNTGAHSDGFLVNALKTLRLSRLLLHL